MVRLSKAVHLPDAHVSLGGVCGGLDEVRVLGLEEGIGIGWEIVLGEGMEIGVDFVGVM
jgi:hypothetical protein